MKFWDSSGVVLLCVSQPLSPAAAELLREDSAMATWWGTALECWGALSRHARAHDLDRLTKRVLQAKLRALAAHWTEVDALDLVRTEGERLLDTYPLSTADALQLAAARVWCEGRPFLADFVCFDHQLRAAATNEGYLVLPREITA